MSSHWSFSSSNPQVLLNCKLGHNILNRNNWTTLCQRAKIKLSTLAGCILAVISSYASWVSGSSVMLSKLRTVHPINPLAEFLLGISKTLLICSWAPHGTRSANMHTAVLCYPTGWDRLFILRQSSYQRQ